MENLLTLGQRINYLLKTKNMSQKDLAEQVNVTPAAMSRYIANEREPRTITTAKIAEAFNVSIDWLLGNTADPNHSQLQEAVTLVARNSNNLSAEQKRLIIDSLIK